MPNQLSVPFKKTYVIPLREAVRQYILTHYTAVHPDAYRWDINHWEKLRGDVVGTVVHIDRVSAFISYHAQLVFILTKLPSDIGLEVPYAPVFNNSALPESYNSLIYERAGVLFNLGALYCQLGAAEDRATPQGLKQAIKFYQSAAGAFDHLYASAVPQLQSSLAPDDCPLELTEPFVKGLEFLMLAQAQECVWQRAVMDNYKNGLIAKLAAKVSSFYGSAVSHVKHASIRHIFPSSWVAHMETKLLHFQAAAQYRKSLEDLEAHKYGHEVARLSEAQTLAKKGYDTARRGGAATAVLQDIKSLLDIVQKSFSRAERDNDLIYHQDVLAASALPAIAEVSMAQPMVDPGLQDPKTVVGNDAVIFGELLGWGARLATEIYEDRRQNWITEEITDRVRRLDDAISGTLESLNLPAALDALDRPIGLPPSLVKKAEEVRLDSGPERVETSIRDVQTLGQNSLVLLDEAMDILDTEAEEDETFQENCSSTERLPSHEANKELIEKAQRYRAIIQQAADSDALVRQKWEEWEENIVQLTLSESELEILIPSSTVSSTVGGSGTGADPTRGHARALRVLLERLDDMSKARSDLLAKVDRLASTDDVTPRILKAASAMEQWVNVQPAMFEDILDEELSKYDKFRTQLEEDERKQSELLAAVRERHSDFMQSRKEDVTVKAREHALQSLDLAYHKYKEIVRNLEEGMKFYNDFAVILSQFRDTCKEWAALRSDEISTLTRALEELSIPASAPPTADSSSNTAASSSSFTAQPEAVQVPPEEHAPPRRHPGHRVRPGTRGGAALDLPPPDSDEWESVDIPAGPISRKGAGAGR